MQHMIDLGDDVVITVKLSGKEYSLREPSVGEVDKFRERDMAAEGSRVIIEFLASLGMPEEVVRSMGMSKAEKLINGLMEVVSKKK